MRKLYSNSLLLLDQIPFCPHKGDN